MPDNFKHIKIIIPTNIFSDIPSLREKTVRVANLVRTLFMFRVNELVLFKYKYEDKTLIKLINFFKIPSYLRKIVFPKDKDLIYTGIAPPIRSLVEESDSLRTAIVIKVSKTFSLVNAGFGNLIKIKNTNLKKGQIIQIVKLNEEWKVANKFTNIYLGFNLKIVDNLLFYLKGLKKKNCLLIFTSKELNSKGKIINIKILNELFEKIKRFSSIAFLFGSPKEGLLEIFSNLGENIESFSDIIINLFPEQGVVTIRTDEAIFGTLSIFNILTTS